MTLSELKAQSQKEIAEAVVAVEAGIGQYREGLITADELAVQCFIQSDAINRALVNFAGMAIR